MFKSSYEPCVLFPKTTEAWAILSGLWASSSPRLFWRGLQHLALVLRILQNVPIFQEHLAQRSPGDRECYKPLMHSQCFTFYGFQLPKGTIPMDLMDQL